MIDFTKLAKPKTVIVPVLENSFQYHKKTYQVTSENGWYRVKLSGNKAAVIEQNTDFSEFKSIKGYTYNNMVVFNNYDVAKRNFGLGASETLQFNNAPTMSAVEAVVWEDKKVYYTQLDYSNFKIFEMKSCFDSDLSIHDLKGITPELRTVYLFHSIEKEALKQKHIKESLPNRLKDLFEKAGAVLLNYSITGRRVVVDWKLKDGGGYSYNSVLDKDTFRTIEAGYCMTNDDHRHGITSMVLTAKEYEERRVIHITRN